MTDIKERISGMIDALGDRHVDVRLIWLLALVALILVVGSVWLGYVDIVRSTDASTGAEQGEEASGQLADKANSLQRLIDDEQVQALALRAIRNPDGLADLRQYVAGRTSDVETVSVYPADLSSFDPGAVPNGYALLDMLLLAESGGFPPLQIHRSLEPPRLLDVVAVMEPGAGGESAGEATAGTGSEVEGDASQAAAENVVKPAIAGYLVITADPELILSQFNPDISSTGYINLSQNNGRQPATVLKQFGTPPAAGEVTEKLVVPGTLFRIETPSMIYVEFVSRWVLALAFLIGLLGLAVSWILLEKSKEWNRKQEEARQLAALSRAEDEYAEAQETRESTPTTKTPAVRELASDGRAEDSESTESTSKAPTEESRGQIAADPPPMRLRYDINERHRMKPSDAPEVELTPEIFRAYDIRGVVGKTLDAGVAEKVGQVLGTLAIEKQAGPVVVARDGRLSGPDLVDGMVKGIKASGCDVLDIGAVPTGVLYYAAHELAKGSGVMITGSHNPPDYNGFKIMVAGETLFGEQITNIHTRIVEGQFRVGEGQSETADVISQYRERISSDIKLDRPLRVVIDCGNGIGGVCAADVLRDIGAEVLPLFDEVDGTFPNHHPDPSDPENLQDLIEAVRLMDADLGLALDGDADRLGVVTLGGSIIYPDRVMMLLAMDVLDRVPGATIIYDVKCTGHLAKVIKEAGGNPVMYKTGHSLIKARMKEIGSPFAGEMSGHFFFGERWYGVDDGIYAAARLLEILAGAEAPPEAILNALPTSFSTPELKVQMQEGENHAFIDELQSKARFENADVSTIDGVRADFKDGWGLCRASNTTPILVVRFDAETEEALERIKNVFRSKMLAINPDLELPF